MFDRFTIKPAGGSALYKTLSAISVATLLFLAPTLIENPETNNIWLDTESITYLKGFHKHFVDYHTNTIGLINMTVNESEGAIEYSENILTMLTEAHGGRDARKMAVALKHGA